MGVHAPVELETQHIVRCRRDQARIIGRRPDDQRQDSNGVVHRDVLHVGRVERRKGLGEARAAAQRCAVKLELAEVVDVRRIGNRKGRADSNRFAVGVGASAGHRRHAAGQRGRSDHVRDIGFRIVRHEEVVAIDHVGQSGIGANDNPALRPVAKLVSGRRIGGEHVGCAIEIVTGSRHGSGQGRII